MLSAVGLLAAISNNIDSMFVGRILGATALGFYSIAFLVPNLPSSTSRLSHSRCSSAFAAHDRDDLSRAFQIAFRYLWLLTLPVVLILIVFAEPIVLVVFGEKWRAAADRCESSRSTVSPLRRASQPGPSTWPPPGLEYYSG